MIKILRALYTGNIQTGISLANELVKANEKILSKSCINISKEKERIKINFYYQNPTKSIDDLIIKNQKSEDGFIETIGRKVDLKKKAKFKEISDRSNLKDSYEILDSDGNNIK